MKSQTGTRTKRSTTTKPRTNGHSWKTFAEPQGWAMKWDQRGLDHEFGRNGHHGNGHKGNGHHGNGAQ